MENEAEQQQPRPQERKERKKATSYSDIRQTFRSVKTVVRVVRMATNPAVIWALVGVFISIIIYMLFFSGAGALPGGGGSSSNQPPTTGTTNPKTPPIPGLTLSLTGPNTANFIVDKELGYTVSISYDKTIANTPPIENITVYLDVPANSSFVRASGNNTQNGGTISWSLSDTQNQSSLTFVLSPLGDDITIPVKVYAKVSGGGSAGGSSPQAFRDLIAGQGKNTAVLGDKAQFVSTILANSSGLPISGKDQYLSQIYDTAIHYNVNPLLLTVIWGIESTFDTTGSVTPYPFGCIVQGDEGFDENVKCAAGSLNVWMKAFETNNVGGSLEIPSDTGNTCIYTDAFDYAYEWYTPVCHYYDGNDPERVTFINFYAKLKGT